MSISMPTGKDELTVYAVRPREITAFFWLFVMAAPVLEASFSTQVTEAFWYKVIPRVIFAIISLVWLASDAKLRGFERARTYIPWCILFPEITIPVYVIRTRGGKLFGVWFVKVIALVASALLFAAVLTTMMHGIPVHGRAT